MKIMTFQEEALTWCVDVLSSQLSAGDCKFFTTAVQKLMFLEPVEEYNLSSSSGTVELNSFQLVAFSMHASEEVLARIILMGISNQFPMQQEDALHIIEKLVWRAAASDKHAFGTLFADSLQLPAAIMKLSSFYLPSVSRQPLPQLVIKDLYWRSCLVIIVIAAYNPATIGKSVWENFPSVRYLLQYLITEGTKSGLSAADILEDKEAVLNDIKAEEILDSFLIKELECEPTNVMEPWKGNIMLLNTQTNRRKPPTYILEELKDIEPSYDLGRRIRSCTEPSFLCNTVSSQDFKEAWEWIQKVAGKQPEVLGMLPCDWQCKLLYRFIFQAAKSPIHDFLHNLRKLFSEDKASEGDAVSVMKFLSDKLVSRNSHVRACGRKCISGIMNGMVSKTADPTVDIYAQSAEFTWLEALEIAKQAATVSSAIQEALQYESSIDVVWAYLKFLKKQLSTSSLAYLSARLLVSRKLLASSLLSTSAKEIISGWNGENAFPILEFFLDAFNTVCTQPLSKWDDVPGSLVKLFSKRHDGTVFHMEIPNIVVEAMVKLLGFIGSNENESSREMVSYENIVQFLLPGFLAKDGDLSMAYIELSTGEKLSILSKEQQDCLISTKDARLVKAGLMDMDARLKVDALINLHVSVEARECLLEELSRLSESSVKNILQPLSTWERLWISGCFPNIEEPGTSPFLKSICELKENVNAQWL
ncbi:integrator complex subunit 1 isoform X2 [Selaginella moellendorffii]|uniref:integrator complex subunit 1 isoform X2 n=1 Tax=Selaginella moellendorffii TaxID=88036 RepID=UPI000D1C9224|nr:integrator complex subunit 1 isoform X2 [Selaginella moellendorffii]|eukprot:XP_024536749.1 integrator complex subunit 1 isoform X2 [Selaginella moellendorffii]